jgi:hypothetical protein
VPAPDRADRPEGADRAASASAGDLAWRAASGLAEPGALAANPRGTAPGRPLAPPPLGPDARSQPLDGSLGIRLACGIIVDARLSQFLPGLLVRDGAAKRAWRSPAKFSLAGRRPRRECGALGE